MIKTASIDKATFTCDDWAMITELTTNSTQQTTNYYVWGLDLSQTLQGAGGVGGLLSQTHHSSPVTLHSFPTYDANGNIVDYVSTNGTTVAHYDYGPFGGTIASTGSKENDFAFRFSTKYLDEEPNLYYYGYRFYSPEMGRWLSRDPIRYIGGPNYYLFISNDPQDKIDYLGMLDINNPHDPSECCTPWRDYTQAIVALLGLQDCASTICDKCRPANVIAGYQSRQKRIVLCEGNVFTTSIILEEVQHAWDAKVGGWCGRDPTCPESILTNFRAAYCKRYSSIEGSDLQDSQIAIVYNMGVFDLAGEGCMADINAQPYSHWRTMIKGLRKSDCWENNIKDKKLPKAPDPNRCCSTRKDEESK